MQYSLYETKYQISNSDMKINISMEFRLSVKIEVAILIYCKTSKSISDNSSVLT